MKISVIGAGNVGALSAMHIAEEHLGDVALIDIVKGVAQGKAFDLEDARSVSGSSYKIEGFDNIDNIKDSGIVVITAGLPRKPGMTREDLLHKNAQIIKEVCLKVKILAPDSIVIVVTNPLDAMAYFALQVTGFDRRRVFGMGVSLDAARFNNLISKRLKVKNTDVKAQVIGSHGEAMLPLARFTYVNGRPLSQDQDVKAIEELSARTKDRGKEIVSLLGTGSAFFAPSVAITRIVRAIVKDEKAELGVSALLEGEYGLKDICIGVPCCIGKDGIEKIVELDLNGEEKSAFLKSADSIRSLNELLTVIL
ncbi:MAG: malate dehydrogenase [Candidatus Omnitrophica bacterium]|nr:malate dehydrogenase [Candidatus Omnitrophota bacterium]